MSERTPDAEDYDWTSEDGLFQVLARQRGDGDVTISVQRPSDSSADVVEVPREALSGLARFLSDHASD